VDGLWTALFGCETLNCYHKQALVTKIHGTLLVLTCDCCCALPVSVQFAAQHELARSRPPLPSATQRFSPQHRQPPHPQHYAGSYQSSSESSLEGPSYFHSYQQDTGHNQHTSLTAGAPSERTPLVQSSANITPKARHDLVLQQDPSQRGSAVSYPAKDAAAAARPTQVARDQSGLCDYRHHSGFLAME
jgi:hypothetical protein